MTQLYPVSKKAAFIIALLIYSIATNAQSLNFNAPTLESGTDLQPGAVYRFKSVTTSGYIDALVKIDSLIGLSLSGIDAAPSGSSTTAFQPQVSSSGGIGYHYAVFTITFVNKNATTCAGFYQNQAGWNGNDLFSLNMRGNEVAPILLPVTLISFTAQYSNEKVWLAWSTKREENVSHYCIERSIDNKTFDQVGLLFPYEDASTTNTYSYKEAAHTSGATMLYYRLKIVDKDGKYSYSETKMVRIGSTTGSTRLSTWPNPVVNELHVTAPTGWKDQPLHCQLLNAMGSIIKSFSVLRSATIVMTDVPAGTYFLKVSNDTAFGTQTIVKSNN